MAATGRRRRKVTRFADSKDLGSRRGRLARGVFSQARLYLTCIQLTFDQSNAVAVNIT